MGKTTGLIVFCLASLGFITLLAIVSGNDFVSTFISQQSTIEQTLNGSTSEFQGETASANLALDPLLQAVIWISIVGAIAIASSVTVVATGLSESGTRWTVGIIFYVAIWTILSGLSSPLILSWDVYGAIVYWGLTIIYAITAIFSLNSGGG